MEKQHPDMASNAVARITDAFAGGISSPIGEVRGARMRSPGKIPTTFLWRDDGGIVKLTGGLLLDALGCVPGLLPGFVSGQIFIPADVVGPLADVPGSSARPGAPAEMMCSAVLIDFSALLADVERRLKMTVVARCSGLVKFDDVEYHRILLVKTAGSYGEAIAAAYEAAFGYKPVPGIVKDHAKMVDYLGTDIYDEKPLMTADVVNVPKRWFVNPAVVDGSAIHLPGRTEKMLMDHPAIGIVSDHDIIHFRAVHASILKGTLVPVTERWVRENVAPAHRHLMMAILVKGYVVTTADTFKKAPAGIYKDVTFWWHNSSNTMPVMSSQKVMFPAAGMELITKNTAALRAKIGDATHKLMAAIDGGPRAFANFFMKNDATSENMSMDSGSMMTLLGMGIDPAMHRGTKKALVDALPSAFKSCAELKTNLGSMMFAAGDDSLPKDVIGVPMEFATTLKRRIKGTYIDKDGWVHLPVTYRVTGIRHPVMLTSLRKIKLRVRLDELSLTGRKGFRMFTMNTETAAEINGDFDGDKFIITVWKKELFDFVQLNKAELDENLASLPESLIKVVGKVTDGMDVRDYIADKLTRKTDLAPVPAHHARLFELYHSEAVGMVSYTMNLLRAYLWRNESANGYKGRHIVAITHLFQEKLVNGIINGKKHDADRVVSLPAIAHLMCTIIEEFFYGPAYAIVNGKCNFRPANGGPTDYDPIMPDVDQKPMLDDILNRLGDTIRKKLKMTWRSGIYPVHEAMFDALLSMPPALKVPTEAGFSRDKALAIMEDCFKKYSSLMTRAGIRFAGGQYAISPHFNAVFDAYKRNRGNYRLKSAQMQMSAQMNAAFDYFMSVCNTDDEKAAMQFTLVAIAHVMLSTDGKFLHSWIFNRVSAVVITEYLKILHS